MCVQRQGKAAKKRRYGKMKKTTLINKLIGLEREYAENDAMFKAEIKKNGFTNLAKEYQRAEANLYRRISLCKLRIAESEES
jgi:hypothetical protein